MSDTAVIFDPDTYVRGMPYDALARLREREPVTRVDEVAVDEVAVNGGPAGTAGTPGDTSRGHGGSPGYWAVWRHADVRQVLRQPTLFSSSAGATQIRDPATAADLAYARRSMLNMDPPEHTRLRGLLGRAFTPRAVALLEERIAGRARAIVEDMLAAGDTGGGTGEADFAKAAADLPVWTLADILGVPAEDRHLLFDWASRVIGFQDPEYAAIELTDRDATTPMAQAALAVRPVPDRDGRMPDPRSRAGIPDLYAYAHELAAHKRVHPAGDIMSILLQEVDEAGGRVSIEEFENLFWLFAVAGNETLRNGIPGGMAALLAHPDQWRRLAADRSLLRGAVDELLRWWTPVIHFRRTATSDTEVAGQPVRAGDKVVVYFASANRDPRVFSRPDEFDVARPNADSHLAFGHGPHFCLGANLGRCQLMAIFDALLDRLESVEPAGAPVRLRSNFQNGIKHLPIRWRLR